MRKLKISYKAAGILDWVFTLIYMVLAFWIDWRLCLVLLAYNISCVFNDVQTEIKRDAAARDILGIVREAIKEAKEETNNANRRY